MIVNVGNFKKINKSLVQSTAISDEFFTINIDILPFQWDTFNTRSPI
jgi:hypothetical protein